MLTGQDRGQLQEELSHREALIAELEGDLREKELENDVSKR